MTLVALTQEPEVKVRLAMIGRYCLPACASLVHGEEGTCCHVYRSEWLHYEGAHDGPRCLGPGYLRCAACVAEHGGAE